MKLALVLKPQKSTKLQTGNAPPTPPPREPVQDAPSFKNLLQSTIQSISYLCLLSSPSVEGTCRLFSLFHCDRESCHESLCSDIPSCYFLFWFRGCPPGCIRMTPVRGFFSVYLSFHMAAYLEVCGPASLRPSSTCPISSSLQIWSLPRGSQVVSISVWTKDHGGPSL